jgi:hypothetical protein
MMSRFLQYIDEKSCDGTGNMDGAGKKKRKRKGKMDEDTINEIVSPQMRKMTQKMKADANAVRNQMRMDGYDKEADQVFLAFSDALNMINKAYK